MTITERDASILTQVAFKEAAAKSDVTTDEGVVEFDIRFAVLTEKLFAAVEAKMAEHATAVPVQRGYDGEAALRNELGATPVSGVTVVQTKDGNGQQGPLPDWFIEAAAAAGVTKVYDNRHKLGENPKLPWFKAVDGDKPFWPPRKGK